MRTRCFTFRWSTFGVLALLTVLATAGCEKDGLELNDQEESSATHVPEQALVPNPNGLTLQDLYAADGRSKDVETIIEQIYGGRELSSRASGNSLGQPFRSVNMTTFSSLIPWVTYDPQQGSASSFSLIHYNQLTQDYGAVTVDRSELEKLVADSETRGETLSENEYYFLALFAEIDRRVAAGDLNDGSPTNPGVDGRDPGSGCYDFSKGGGLRGAIRSVGNFLAEQARNVVQACTPPPPNPNDGDGGEGFNQVYIDLSGGNNGGSDGGNSDGGNSDGSGSSGGTRGGGGGIEPPPYEDAGASASEGFRCELNQCGWTGSLGNFSCSGSSRDPQEDENGEASECQVISEIAAYSNRGGFLYAGNLWVLEELIKEGHAVRVRDAMEDEFDGPYDVYYDIDVIDYMTAVGRGNWNLRSFAGFRRNRIEAREDADYFDREPVLPFVGTVADIVDVLNNQSPRGVGLFEGQQAAEYLLSLGGTDFRLKNMRPLPNQTGFFNQRAGRYIYTPSGGWIDMVHFFFYAGRAYQYLVDGEDNPIGEAVQDGFLQERADQVMAPHSAFSYEDLPSDLFGATWAVEHFDPTSSLSFSEQLRDYFECCLGIANPQDAPNFDQLPTDDERRPVTFTNSTTTPIFTTQ